MSGGTLVFVFCLFAASYSWRFGPSLKDVRNFREFSLDNLRYVDDGQNYANDESLSTARPRVRPNIGRFRTTLRPNKPATRPPGRKGGPKESPSSVGTDFVRWLRQAGRNSKGEKPAEGSESWSDFSTGRPQPGKNGPPRPKTGGDYVRWLRQLTDGEALTIPPQTTVQPAGGTNGLFRRPNRPPGRSGRPNRPGGRNGRTTAAPGNGGSAVNGGSASNGGYSSNGGSPYRKYLRQISSSLRTETFTTSPFTGGSSSPFTGVSSSPFTGVSSSPFTGGSSSPFTGGSSSPFTGGSSSPFTGGSSSSFTGGSSSSFTGGSSTPFTGGSSTPFTGGSSSPFTGSPTPPMPYPAGNGSRPMRPSRLPFEIDNLFLKYALGLVETEGYFDAMALASTYFKVYKVLGDEYITTAQFSKTIALQMMGVRNGCMASRVSRFILVVIASTLQEGWRAIVNWIPPILDEMIPDLADKAIGVRDEIPNMLGMMLIRKSIVPFARRMLPGAFVKDFATIFRTELLNTSTNPTDFGNKISTLLFDKLNAEVPVCPDFHKISVMYQEELPKLSDSIATEVVDIVVELRTKLELVGVTIANITAIEELFSAIAPFIQDGIHFMQYKFGTGNPEDIRNALRDIGIYLPADLTVPVRSCDSAALNTMRQCEDFLIGVEGPLRELVDELEGVHFGIP